MRRRTCALLGLAGKPLSVSPQFTPDDCEYWAYKVGTLHQADALTAEDPQPLLSASG